MNDYLTVDDLVRIAQRVVSPTVHVSDWGLLASAAARPAATAFGEDAYPELAVKAAALLDSLVRNHALLDGNKRLGWAAAVVFCDLNGFELAPDSHDAAFDIVMVVADGSLTDLHKISQALDDWLRPE